MGSGGAVLAACCSAANTAAAAPWMPEVLRSDAVRPVRNGMPDRLEALQAAGRESIEQERVPLQRGQEPMPWQPNALPADPHPPDCGGTDEMHLRPRLLRRSLRDIDAAEDAPTG